MDGALQISPPTATLKRRTANKLDYMVVVDSLVVVLRLFESEVRGTLCLQVRGVDEEFVSHWALYHSHLSGYMYRRLCMSM